ncbi:TPA: hypothetical protein ACPZCX_000221 [Citrobacter freundii]|uniref:hypothetical protein n=1 Tax=Citrobacter sp. Cpo074 TaxID=2985135 RepID=UPI0025777597|nr:hypothetical protein [Citrobacter sp. Cpo074]MDM2850216.1 hypothetical protein [Citrobacter sp. Cpo074]
MSKYEKLDRLIMNKIGGHPTPFHQIFVRDVEEESKRIAEEDGSGHPFRFVDRRLQSLRKKGVIRNVTGKGWVRA